MGYLNAMIISITLAKELIQLINLKKEMSEDELAKIIFENISKIEKTVYKLEEDVKDYKEK